MKKLRLIKPWRLRTVRQSLSDVRVSAEELIQYIPCQGPSSGVALAEPRAVSLRDGFMAGVSHLFSGSPESNFPNPVRAPFSDVIFVSTNTTR